MSSELPSTLLQWTRTVWKIDRYRYGPDCMSDVEVESWTQLDSLGQCSSVECRPG